MEYIYLQEVKVITDTENTFWSRLKDTFRGSWSSLGETAEGLLCGGNLSLVSSSLGTPYEIDTKGKILFLEDLHEALYRLDGMFNHLRLAGKFKDAAGILLGYWIDCPDEKGVMELETVLRDMIPADKPVLYNYSCGHSLPTMSLPLGEKARIDLKTKTLTIL